MTKVCAEPGSAGPRSGWLRRRGLPLLVLASGLGLSLLYWQRELSDERQHLRSAFDTSLRDIGQRIEQRMAAHEHLLQGLRGLIEAVPPADAPMLRRYVDSLPLGADFAGVQGLGLVLQADASELPALLQDWRRRDGANALQLRPAGARERYAPLLQLEPELARNAAQLGRDLWADAVTRRALEAARDSGRLALSARLATADVPAAFLMALPIYRGQEPPDSLRQRRDRLRGWVVAPVQLPELMASLYGELPAGLALSILEAAPGAEPVTLYRSPGRTVAADATLLQGREFLVLGGHTWTLELRAGPAFAALHGAEGGDGVMLTGLVLTLLLSLLTWQLATAHDRAQALAERMTQALRVSEQRWAFALEGAGDGVWDWQPVSGSISASPRWKQLMGLADRPGEPDLAQMLSCVHPEDRAGLQAELQACMEGPGQTLASEYRVADGVGGWRWVLARATVAEREGARALRVIGTLSDIDARRLSEERVRFMALHDPLTELANRAHFGERMHFALANARRYHESIGLILLDLDRFKPVNDSHGHAIGDQLLQTVARRIKSSVRETDTVGRIGGDEFVVLLTGPVTRETAQLVADKIFNQVAQPLELGGLRIEITCSLGLALYPEDGQDELSLTKAADDAMYRSKRAGRRLLGEVGGGFTNL
ncbi:MAG TPA: GGDEF domain-containing protein [Roseateles sp.]|nr:GGDEF domain-containing protein [Roseateles sp.]